MNPPTHGTLPLFPTKKGEGDLTLVLVVRTAVVDYDSLGVIEGASFVLPRTTQAAFYAIGGAI
jgi:hypothetical protein